MQDFKPESARRPAPSGVVDRVLSKVEDGLVIIAGAVVLILMVVVTLDVIMRSLFNYPLPNSYEYMEMGMVFAVYLGAAQVQREKGHIAIDAVVKVLPPRGRAAVELFGCFVGLVLMVAIGWWGAQAAWNSYVTSEYIGSVARLPVLPARLALLAGVIVLSLRLLVDMAQYTGQIIKPTGETAIMDGHV